MDNLLTKNPESEYTEMKKQCGPAYPGWNYFEEGLPSLKRKKGCPEITEHFQLPNPP